MAAVLAGESDFFPVKVSLILLIHEWLRWIVVEIDLVLRSWFDGEFDKAEKIVRLIAAIYFQISLIIVLICYIRVYVLQIL